MDEHCWPHLAEIEAITFTGGDGGEFRVGQQGVTRIEATIKPGLHCNLPYVRVWKGDVPVSEFCQHALEGVIFKVSTDG